MAAILQRYGNHRLLEMIPGLAAWSLILLTIVLSFFAPQVAIVIIILFDLYWMLRVFYFVVHIIASYRAYRQTLKKDWEQEVKQLPGYERVFHLVMIPTYKEEASIVEEAIRSLLKAKYRKDRFIVVLGGEEKDRANFEHIAADLQTKYGAEFFAFHSFVHPADVPGEIPGKGSNMRYMGEQIKTFIDEQEIPYDDIVVSAFDVDTLAHEQYFARLAYLYLTVPNPTRSSYQPVTLFSNNIWSSPALVRIAAFGTTFWLFSELVRPERMWTFSSHSMPWRMLVDVGFWEPNIVSEDSRIFMQAFLHYDGEYRVTPIYLPVSMDAVSGETFIESLQALYKQQRRWAWGVEHFPYMVTEFRKHANIPRYKKFLYLFTHLEGTLTWSTAPFIIFILGRLPFLTIGSSQSALIVNSPYTLEWMMRGATVGVFVTGALSFFLLPPRPSQISRFNWLMMLLQWALLPVSYVLFGSLPALEAQTRMMLGKYLGFNVTKKVAANRDH